MKAKEFIVKKRDPNWKTMQDIRKSGAGGAHKDKKKEQKQGYEKHKNKDVGEGLKDPKDNPCWKGYHPVGTKKKNGRTVPNCVPKESVAEGAEFGSYYYEKVAQEIFNKRQDISSEDEVLNQAYHIVANDQGQKSARYMFNYDEDFPSDVVSSYFWLQKNKQGVEEGDKEIAKTHKGGVITKTAQGIKHTKTDYDDGHGQPGKPKLDFNKSPYKKVPILDKDIDERVRDPEDWDEGNTEPGNNFAIYINGKKWKVFPGPYGAYADSPEEEREYYRLKDMARRKSEQTGKKWEVYKTGEPATR